MTDESTDILVSGGGIAGMVAAIAFGHAGFSVICVDPAAPVTNGKANGADMRSTAFLQPSRALLADIGLWDCLEEHAEPLQVMRIIDAGGDAPEPRIQSEFDAEDISQDPFGWNFPNWLLRREALEMLQEMPNVELRLGVGVQSYLARSSASLVRLTNGQRINAQLVVGADGRNSPVRKSANIDVKTIRYGQKALAFTVTHPLPHKNVSTEIHRSGGPFTLVPLPDVEGAPASAVVWMERAPEAERLAALPTAEFEEELNRRSCGILGPLVLSSRRALWPIISQYATQLTTERCALIAEAAHVIPPIGAQGLNMSLADIRTLLDLAKAHRETLGEETMLLAYERARHGEIRARIKGVDLLNRASMAEARPLRDLRALGLNTIYGIRPIRKTLMQMGLGAKA